MNSIIELSRITDVLNESKQDCLDAPNWAGNIGKVRFLNITFFEKIRNKEKYTKEL